jgi:uncharacterized membrane protein YcaP (DUF421 family)
MDLWRIAVRALVAYIYLLITTRASGKSVVSQSTPFDFVVALLLGDLIDDALWVEVPVAKFAGAVSSIVLCDVVVKLGAFHSPRFFRLVNGKSRALLRDGAEDGHELRAEKMNEEELDHELRLVGIDREHWNDVHLALLERDHSLSVILKPGAEPATKELAARVKEMLAR